MGNEGQSCNTVSVRHLRREADLLKHVTMDVIQPPQLLALCGHELAPVMGGLAIQAPPVLKTVISATI